MEELIHDNGLEISHFYKMEAKTLERHLGTVEIPAASFANMNWVHRLGVDAVLEPGVNTRDYVRHYVQISSKPIRVIAYTHTGWRKIDDVWIYLTSGGAIGKVNVTVSLADELHRYSLPQVPTDEPGSIKQSLSFLDLGSRKITLPLFAYLYLAPLTMLLSPLPNFLMFPYGETGVFKTTLAILMLAHFGNFNSIENLNNFEDTANALGRHAFTLKDTLMVVDDYHPSTQRHLAQQKEATLQRLIREFSNRTERARLNSDSTEKPRYSPRGMLLVTGEELLSLQGTLVRACVIEIKKGDIDKKKLGVLQAQSYLLPHAMSSFIHWLRHTGIENIQSEFKKTFLNFRAGASNEHIHPKLTEQVAFLQFSLVNILDWLLDKGVVSESQARELKDEGWKVFCELALEHDRRIRAEDPVGKFIDILGSLIIQRKVRIENKEDSSAAIGGSAEERAELVGFFDEFFLYLLPTPIWNAVQKYLSSSNEYFPTSKNTLFNILMRRKLVETHNGDYRLSLRVGEQVHKVIKLRRGVVLQDASTTSTEEELMLNYL